MESFKNDVIPSEKYLSRFEMDTFYATTDIKGFLAVSLSGNAGFRKEASAIPYLKTSKNILERFGEIIVDLLNKIRKIENIEGTLAEKAIYTSLASIEVLNNKLIKNISRFNRPPGDPFASLTEEELNLYFGSMGDPDISYKMPSEIVNSKINNLPLLKC